MALQEKMKMVPTFKLKEREEEINQTLTELELALNVQAAKKATSDAAKEAVEISKRQILGDAKGSNAEKRRADAETTMATDEGHLALVVKSDDAQGEYIQAEITATMLARKLAAQRGNQAAVTNLMYFLGGQE